MGKFRPRELREDATLPELRRQLNEIQKEIAVDLAAATARGKVSSLQLDGPYSASYGETVRVSPPTAGFRLILPPVNLEQPNATVRVVIEGDTGPLTVEAVDTTINGEDTLSFLAGIGTAEFLLTPAGWYAFSGNLSSVANVVAGNPGTEGTGITINGSTYEAVLKASDIGSSNLSQLILHQHSSSRGPRWVTARTSSDTTAHTIVASGDSLGTWYAAGHDGVDYALAGHVRFACDGTPGSNDMPGRFEIATTPDGAQTSTERLRISSAGAWGLAGANYGTAGQLLRSAGSSGPPTWGTAAQVVDLIEVEAATWTATQTFEGQVLLGADQEESGTGAINVTLGNVVRLLFDHATGNHTLGTVSGCADSRLLMVEFLGTGTHTITHDATSADAFACPGNVNLVITGRGGFIAVGRQGANANWKILATTN